MIPNHREQRNVGKGSQESRTLLRKSHQPYERKRLLHVKIGKSLQLKLLLGKGVPRMLEQIPTESLCRSRIEALGGRGNHDAAVKL